MFSDNRCKFAYMNTYSDRLKSAMEEAGYGGPGGQTKLAKEIGARSQTINQAVSGGSKELSATFHVRACMRLGVLPLWLSEGKGRRYELEMVVVDEANRTYLETNLVNPVAHMVAESSPQIDFTPTPRAQLSDTETRMVRLLREQPDDVVESLAALIDTITRHHRKPPQTGA